MTPLLQQAREALQPFAAQFVSETGACHSELTDAANCGRCSKILAARSVIASLDAYEAMSPYDKAVEALAENTYDGWVCQDSDGSFWWFDKTPTVDGERASVWNSDCIFHRIYLNIPYAPDWRASLREIRAGRVVPQGEWGRG